MKEFETIAVFNFPHEIIVLKSILDHEGIPYLFQNENLISVDPFAIYAYGGIQLKIHPNDFLQVNEILNNLTGNEDLKIV